MSNNLYEMKIEDLNIWVAIELLDISKNNFSVRISDSNVVQNFRNLILRKLEVEREFQSDSTEVEILINFQYNGLNLKGWTNANVISIKNEFTLVEYSHQKIFNKKIIPKNCIRYRKSHDQYLNLSHDSLETFSLNFLNSFNFLSMKSKIESLKNHINKLVLEKITLTKKFIFYSESENNLYILISPNERDQVENILEIAIEHYSEIARASHIQQEHQLEEQQATKAKKKRYSEKNEKVDKYLYSTIYEIEKFIFEMIKSKIENLKKNSLIKIEYKNSKDPNFIKIEYKSNDQELFNKASEELKVIQKYLTLELPDTDSFFSNSGNFTLRNYVSMFNLLESNIFKLDANSVSVRLIGKEKEVFYTQSLIEEYIKSRSIILAKENEYEEIKKITINIK